MDGTQRVFVGLGANLGDAAANLREALRLLAGVPQTTLVRASSLYRSAPLDASGPDYINAVAELRTRLSAHELLVQLQAIERRCGRERPYRHAPRTLDLDLLLYGEHCVESPDLTVPHPRMQQRAFVLAPLAELAPRLRLAGGHDVAQALAALANQRIERLGR